MELDSRIAQHLGADPADAQFRLLVESVTDYAIYLLDSGGRVMSWNPGAERIKGYSAGEILGRHFSIFYPGEDRAAGKPAELLRHAEREGRYHDEGWRLRKDGSRFWADVLLTTLRDPAGRLTGFAKLTRDMTALRREREREQLLKEIFEGAPGGIGLCEAKSGRIVRANPALARLFGYSEQELHSKTVRDITHPDDLAETIALYRQVTSGERQFYSTEKRYVRKDGSILWARLLVSKVGEHVLAQVEDIGERKRAEQTLAEQRTLLAEAQKLAGLGCWEWDPNTGRVTWSEQLYRMYGVDPESFQPNFENYLERVHPDDRQQSGSVMARALIDGRGFTLEERILRPDGGTRHVRSHGEVVRDDSGRPLKLLGACLDITEQRNSEVALRRAASGLQALTRRLVEVEEGERRRIAGELHDRVGQNLSALNINLDIVLGALGESAPKDLRVRLRDSLALVDGTLQSIENVMAELRPPLLEEYGLGAALGWHAEEFSRRTGIEIEFQDHARERNRGLRREAAVALFRIAQEALNNVAKHANAKRVRIAVAVEDGQMAVSVADDGTGFDPAGADARTTRWGMSTMRERAEAAGGSLEIRSSPGHGTTLKAKVPF